MQKGFVSLISAIVISLVLMIAIITMAERGLAGRFLLLDIENKEISRGLAEACVAVAQIAIVNDPAYTTNNVALDVGTRKCTIVSVGDGEIMASGKEKGATTNLDVQVDLSTGGIASWREI